MKTKVLIISILVLISGGLLINGYVNEEIMQETNITTNKTQNNEDSTNTTTTTKTSKNAQKTTNKVQKTTKKVVKSTKTVQKFNVKASKSEMQQYARSILSVKDYEALDFIITHESGWNANNVNKKSGASGLCQALPASKMAVSGKDYKTNYKTQINWCILYCNTRYGSIQKAKAFWLKHHWF